MDQQTIQSQDLKVADLFQSFYAVPDYQREYVWETDQVEQLLTDVQSEWAGLDPKNAPEYFVGSIVVCPGKSGVVDLIDGQQRMTTLFVTFCAIRDRFDSLAGTAPGTLGGMIAAVSTDEEGKDQFRYRLDLQYKDSGGILEKMAKGLPLGGDAATRSISNIANAYEVATGFLRREFADDQDKQRKFYGYLVNKVRVIRIQTTDVAKALKVFETINDRGLGLDSMDLLKNLLFMKAKREEFDKLKGTWKKLQDAIFGAGEKPLRFLRYYILGQFEVEALREDEIYGWFSRNEALCGYGKTPCDFAERLLAAANAYAFFLKGSDREGKRNRYLENLQFLGGKAARQHLVLLLAGRHLDAGLFDRLAGEVEDLFFTYVITREATRDFERNFARWAPELRQARTEVDLEAFFRNRFEPAKRDLARRFDDAVRRLEVGSVQRYRLRYLLAKLTQHVDLQAYGDTEGTKWLKRYVGEGFEIEHVFPQSPAPEASQEFGPSADANVANRLGNFVLVEKSINASLGNRAFSRKRSVYLQSQLLLTRALAERPKVGSNTKIDAAVARIAPFEAWNEAAVTKRQGMMVDLAREVWSVPSASEAP